MDLQKFFGFLGFFSSFWGFFHLRKGLFGKINSAFDRARRVLSETMFGLTWSNPQANRPRIYTFFWSFSSVFGDFFSPGWMF